MPQIDQGVLHEFAVKLLRGSNFVTATGRRPVIWSANGLARPLFDWILLSPSETSGLRPLVSLGLSQLRFAQLTSFYTFPSYS